MGLTRTVDPATALLTTAEAKAQVQIPSSDTSQDSYLDDLVTAATEKAEQYTGRAFINQTWELTLDDFPAWALTLPRPPLVSVSSIAYVDDNGDSQTLSSSLYIVGTKSKPGRLTPTYDQVWPSTRNIIEAVTVTYVAGYGSAASSVPDRALQAVRLTVANWYANREAVVVGTISGELPQNAMWLLNGLRVGVVPGGYRVTK